MERRTVLGWVIGVGALGGGYFLLPRGPPTPGPIQRIEITSTEIEDDVDIHPTDPPQLRTDHENERSTIRGAIFVNDDYLATVGRVEYNRDGDDVGISVTSYKPVREYVEWGSDRLTAYDSVLYNIDMEFEVLPRVLSVTEIHRGDTTTANTTEFTL